MAKMSLTDEQLKLIKRAKDFYNSDSEQVFQFSGPAGTGKSVVMKAIVEELGLAIHDVAPMAYVGAASIVMRLKGLYNARTIHSWIYEPVYEKDPYNMDPYMNRAIKRISFLPKKSIGPIKLILIDEAGSVPMSMKKDIENLGIKIICCGDLNQLPPVSDNPAYLYSGKVHRLTKVMRQNDGNAIVHIANRILEGKKVEIGNYGNVVVCYKDEITDNLLNWADIVICGRNATRDYYNKYIRQMRGCSGKIPIHGERLICRKNNWNVDCDGINLANGLVGEVKNFPDVTTFDGKSYYIDFAPDLFKGTFRNLKCDFRFLNSSDQSEKDRLKRYGTDGEKMEYGYAITTHISQGSQYEKGIYVSEYLPNIKKQLDYTGITRFSSSCIFAIERSKYK